MKKTAKRPTRQPRDARRQSTERHLEMPWPEWQVKKRQQWRAVMSALKAFEYGAAYTPGGNDLYQMRILADRVEDALRADWVSW